METAQICFLDSAVFALVDSLANPVTIQSHLALAIHVKMEELAMTILEEDFIVLAYLNMREKLAKNKHLRVLIMTPSTMFLSMQEHIGSDVANPSKDHCINQRINK
eukprot:g32778.t1